MNTNDPKQKFILFIRATGLEKIREEYKNILNYKKEVTKIYEEKQKSCKEFCNLIKELERKIKNFKSVDTLRSMLKLLQGELIWSKVCSYIFVIKKRN